MKIPAILAIDTATGPCSVAIWKDGHVAGYLENTKPVMQSACLLPMIEQLLAQTHTGYTDLTQIACTTGPGSFTGIRVGLSAARAIGFAGNVPCIGFTTLQVLAHAAKTYVTTQEQILALLTAGKGEYYYQLFSAMDGRALYDPRLGPLEIALGNKNALVVGNTPQAQAPVGFPRADALAALAALHTDQGSPLIPFYIRPPDAKLPGALRIE